MSEETNHFGAEKWSYVDDESISLRFLRLEKKVDDMFQEMFSKLAQLNGRMVKLESAVCELSANMKSNSEHDAHDPGQRYLDLQFSDKVSSPIRTGDEIKGVGGGYIKVALVDETGNLVESGPESSAEVHISAFKAAANDNEHCGGGKGILVEDISKEKKAKNLPLLDGDVHPTLNKGIGILTNIKFRSSARHVSGLYKIGARVTDTFDGIVIQDANTVPFRVKDYREKYSEKHRPPYLSDEIWRLDNIGRGGKIHIRLKEQKLNTVEDFLIQLLKDSDGLKQLVNLQPKKWDATVKHAQTCQLYGKVYCSIGREEDKGIVINAVGDVLGLIVANNYLRIDKLSEVEKVNASMLDVAAFVHKRGLDTFANEASLLQKFPEPVNAFHPSNCTGSLNTIDHGDEASEIADSHQINLDSAFEDVHSSSRHPIVLECLDEEFLESIFADCDDPIPSDSNMCESSVVSNYAVKKKLYLLFTATKWLLNYQRLTACDGNDHQKRRRIT